MGRVVAGVVGVRRLVLDVGGVGRAVDGLLGFLRAHAPAGPPPGDTALRAPAVGHLGEGVAMTLGSAFLFSCLGNRERFVNFLLMKKSMQVEQRAILIVL